MNLVRLLLVLVMFCGTRMAMAGPIYDFNFAIGCCGPGGPGVTGTLETDGTLGTLLEANILDYSLALNDGRETFTITPGNSFFFLGGSYGPSALSATATDLIFNFSAVESLWVFVGNGNEFGLYSTAVPFDNIYINLNNRFQLVSMNLAGSLPIATIQTTSVPEPASLALFCLGLATLGISSRKRKTINSFNPAV